ncbi:serine/threonine protein kinase, partial [Streptomyces sp. SID2563]|nr:serine/threonine protein kinase [Streptomyces sp. SID2563]
AVAGALAAVTVGGAFWLDLMPGTGGDTGNVGQAPPATSGEPSPPKDSATGSATKGPTASPTKDPTSPGGAAELPDAFVGTWTGPLTEKTTGEPHGTLTAVFTKGRKGTDVVRLTTSLSMGFEITCHSVATLTTASDDELKLRERADPDRPSTAGLCTTTPADLHFTRASDGTLRFRSDERGAGLPYGTLTRSDG